MPKFSIEVTPAESEIWPFLADGLLVGSDSSDSEASSEAFEDLADGDAVFRVISGPPDPVVFSSGGIDIRCCSVAPAALPPSSPNPSIFVLASTTPARTRPTASATATSATSPFMTGR